MIHETIIVGAGMAGLSAASMLGEHGHKALVPETRDRIGGRIFSLEENGKAFALGPAPPPPREQQGWVGAGYRLKTLKCAPPFLPHGENFRAIHDIALY